MKIISFAWTTKALLEGKKTVTRRKWSDKYALMFKKGDLVKAYDKSPRSGGKHRATIRLTHDPYKECLIDMPEEDIANEGGLWDSKDEFISLFPDSNTIVWVIRFEVIEPRQTPDLF